ncbi:MAG: GGDEF domain-containing protein [Candidatus Daviesbacteria bacterium]|nr:GGDEF domain-containing protein [Candidatus Daviesbacteria bacterium]
MAEPPIETNSSDIPEDQTEEERELDSYTTFYLDTILDSLGTDLTKITDPELSKSIYDKLLASARALAEDRIRKDNELKALAEHDQLTELLNRRGFLKRFDEKLDTYGRGKYQLEHPEAHGRTRIIDTTTPGPFIMIDLVDFKAVNDKYGHPLGDEVLKSVAEALRTSLRPNDLVARIGGDEFGVFLEGETRKDGLDALKRLQAAIASSTRTQNGIELGASFGLAMLPEHLNSDQLANTYFRSSLFESVYGEADKALYHSKSQPDKNTISYRADSGELQIYKP